MFYYLRQLDQLVLFRAAIEQSVPFYHTRYNDGECLSMFRMMPVSATTSGEHHYTPEISKALMATFTAIAQASKDTHVPAAIAVGTYCFDTRKHNALADIAAAKLKGLIDELGVRGVIQWAASDLWYSTEAEHLGTCIADELLEFIEAIRKASKTQRAFLVCNSKVSDACHCLGAEAITIPQRDAWTSSQETMLVLERQLYAYPESIVVWCGGFPAKVWSWDLWRKYPGSTHIDAGHLFDGAFSLNSRAWLQREKGAHWNFYQNVFIPYVKGYIHA